MHGAGVGEFPEPQAGLHLDTAYEGPLVALEYVRRRFPGVVMAPLWGPAMIDTLHQRAVAGQHLHQAARLGLLLR